MPTVTIKDLERYPAFKKSQELISDLLEMSGYNHDICWQGVITDICRCDQFSPAIEATSVASPYCIRLVCKPNPDSEEHAKLFLYVPNELQSKITNYNINTILHHLQAKQWETHEAWQDKINPPPPPVVVREEPKDSILVHKPEWAKHLTPALEDKSNLRYVLLVVLKLEAMGILDGDEWRKAFVSSLAWEDRSMQVISRVINHLNEKNLIQQNFYGKKCVGYTLSDAGRKFVAGYVITPPAIKDSRKTILPVGNLLQRLAKVAQRVSEIPTERDQLLREIAERQERLKTLEQEEIQIESLLSKPEVYALIQQLKSISTE